MKLSLRNKYFAWLLLLMLAIYLSAAVVMTGMEIHEAHTLGARLSDDIPELIAFVLVMLVTMPLALLIAWHISGRLLRPLQSMMATAERIRSGKLDERVPLPDDHELARLAGTLNEAFDRYSAAVRRLESFSADASHQLRTPMAAIRTCAEVTLQRPRSVEDYEESLADILEQTERLNRTVDQLLLLARIDHSIRREFQPVRLAGLLDAWVREAATMFEGRQLSWSGPPECADWALPANPLLLKQCFDNLINNAVEVSGDGGRILVTLRKTARSMQWWMEDNGPGIPVAERSAVFDRFYRGHQAKGEGSGLGLAIVKEIVQLHGGSVRAEASGTLGGAAMLIEFPLAPAIVSGGKHHDSI